MEDKEYIYVLDYSDYTINQIIKYKNDNREIEDILEENGCNVNTCSWMIGTNRITDITELN